MGGVGARVAPATDQVVPLLRRRGPAEGKQLTSGRCVADVNEVAPLPAHRATLSRSHLSPDSHRQKPVSRLLCHRLRSSGGLAVERPDTREITRAGRYRAGTRSSEIRQRRECRLQSKQHSRLRCGYGSSGLAAPTSTRASHRWIRRAIQKPTQPSSATRSARAFTQNAAPLLQAAVVLEATVNAKQQRAPANSPRCCRAGCSHSYPPRPPLLRTISDSAMLSAAIRSDAVASRQTQQPRATVADSPCGLAASLRCGCCLA